MSVTLKSLLLTPPLRREQATFATLPGASNPTTAEKIWTRGYDPIAQQRIACAVNPSLEQITALFGEEDDLEQILLNTMVHPVNETDLWIQSERDSAVFFDTLISLQVQLAFRSILVRRSESGPLGHTNYAQTIDLTYGHGDICVLCGEFKRHGIINVSRWTGQKTPDTNRTRLGREIRR
jgi:hypothetical protein